MPTILIVDDEAVFRRGLRAMIATWDQEWEVIGDARDGYEALGMIENLKPDAVLTDIRMPRMDGLQLQKIARERFPGLNCIVISGYEDFYYLQQSMRCGARDYITKPVEREELFRVLERLKNDMQTHQLQAESRFAGEQVISQARKHAGEHLASAIMRGTVNQHDLDLLAQLGFEFNEPYFNSLVINLDKESVGEERYRRTDPTLFQLYIQQFVQEIVSHRMHGFSFAYSDAKVAALINMPNPDEAQRRLLDMAESIRLQIKSLSNLTVTIGAGRPVKGFELMPATFREAENALLYRLVGGGDKVIDYKNTLQDPFIKTGLKNWSWEALQKTINEGRTEEIGKRVEHVVTKLCRIAKTPELIHQQICKLVIHYHELSEEMGFTKEWLGDKDIRTLLLGICSISSSEELIEECRTLINKLTVVISNSMAIDRDPIELALRYIDHHHHEPITLKEIADQVFLNPTYFSGLFKQRKGKSFIEHLTEIRVEHAKKRLHTTDDKITVIAEETGFTNIRHFNRVFKNETGLTPKEYREGG